MSYSRSCSHDLSTMEEDSSGDDESSLATCPTPDLLMSGRSSRVRIAAPVARSQSSDGGKSSSNGGGACVSNGRRSNSAAVVAERLYSSPTKATTAKLRAERTHSDGRAMSRIVNQHHRPLGSMGSLPRKPRNMTAEHLMVDHDSGHFSSDTEGHASLVGRHRSVPNCRVGFVPDLPASEARKRSLITGASDEDMEDHQDAMARARQRRERSLRRREQQQQRRHWSNPNQELKVGPVVGPRRVMSPSPVKKRPHLYADRGRRSSDELCYSEESSTTSPPATPTPRPSSSASGRNSSNWSHTLPSPARRTTSSNASKITAAAKSNANYAFGSSVGRFDNASKKHPLNKSSSDGVNEESVHGIVSRTASNSTSSSGHQHKKVTKKESVEKAWLRFKDEVDEAMRRKPGEGQGFYKNLSDMMHTKMEMLGKSDEVGFGIFKLHKGVSPLRGKQVLSTPFLFGVWVCLKKKSDLPCRMAISGWLSEEYITRSPEWFFLWECMEGEVPDWFFLRPLLVSRGGIPEKVYQSISSLSTPPPFSPIPDID